MQDTQNNGHERLVLLILRSGFVVKVKESEVSSIIASDSEREQ